MSTTHHDLNEILGLLKAPSPAETALITKAYEFAKAKHEGQTRFSGEPYFTHLFQTAKILAEIGMGPTTIAAGFLHDTIEDVGVTPEQMRTEFGDEILFLVEGVTKLGKVRYHGTDWHNESLRKFFVATSKDLRVVMIKLADRLHNMRTLESVPQEKQRRIAAETLEVYAPVADRLGMGKLNRELEDLSFPYVYPEEYAKTSELVTRKHEEEIGELEKFHESFRTVLAEEGFSQVLSTYRVKGLYSLYKKLLDYDMDIDKIYDISALRVIVDDVPDCYRVLGIVHSHWRPLPGRIKDYIAFPKPNGYQSLHTTVFTGEGGIVEVQIRTKAMHKESEYGIASHLGYKGFKKGSGESFAWIRRLLPAHSAADAPQSPDVPGWITDLVEYHQENESDEGAAERLKADFFQQRIFVFTPKGDVVDLPIDSTPIDFAYAVHSDIGNRMSGAKVNGKLVSLDSKLANGDIVDIQTKKSAKPNRKWIDAAKTTLAKRHIAKGLTSDKTIEDR